MTLDDALIQFLLRMGDNSLILGHRLSEWCGHAPVLEEDIALANTALDLIGQTQFWLGLAGAVEGEGRDADRLAFHRDSWDFRNILLVELPNGDYGQTLMRQLLFDVWHAEFLSRLSSSADERIAEIAQKAAKEAAYHLKRSKDMVIGLGDGTAQSHARMQAALDYFWPYIGEIFTADESDRLLARADIAPEPASLQATYDRAIKQVLEQARLTIPDHAFVHEGGRSGQRHSEHLGHILTQMQWLQRAYPDASW